MFIKELYCDDLVDGFMKKKEERSFFIYIFNGTKNKKT